MCLPAKQPHIALFIPSPKGGGEVVLGDGSRRPILQGLEVLLGQRPGSQLLHDVERKRAVGARSGRWRRCSMSLQLRTLHQGRVPMR